MIDGALLLTESEAGMGLREEGAGVRDKKMREKRK
jgi:hypothetical protein